MHTFNLPLTRAQSPRNHSPKKPQPNKIQQNPTQFEFSLPHFHTPLPTTSKTPAQNKPTNPSQLPITKRTHGQPTQTPFSREFPTFRSTPTRASAKRTHRAPLAQFHPLSRKANIFEPAPTLQVLFSPRKPTNLRPLGNRNMRPHQLGLCFASLIFAAICFAADGPDKTARPAGPFGIPNEEATAKATRLIKQTFAQEYFSATTLPQRAALAQRLLKEAQETPDDAPVRYVLLCEARDLGAKSADVFTACRAIELLSQLYGVAPGEMTVTALSAASHVAITPQNLEALTRSALAAADQAISRDEYELATRLAAIGEAAAIKTQKIVLITESQDKQKEISWAAKEFASAKAALETLTTKPEDPTAKAAAGRFKCLVKNDWEHGLPLLLECSDSSFKLLAEKDQAAATAGPKEQAEIGDQWWELGNQYLQRARFACQCRAVYWYRKAAPKLAGIPKTIAEKRIDESDLLSLRALHLERGLAGEVFDDAKFGKSFDHRTDGPIDFEWPHNSREGLPKESFSIRWAGQLRAPATGKYTLLIQVNEGAKIYIDDKLVLEELKGTQKRKPTTATIKLNEGMHPIRIEFWDTGGLAKIRLLWQTPGGKAEEVIPARAFVH